MGCGGPVARGVSQFIKHGLGVEVVTLFQHTHQYLVYGVETAHDTVGGLWLLTLANGAREIYPRLAQLCVKPLHELIFSRDKQGREHRVVIIPAPPLSQGV